MSTLTKHEKDTIKADKRLHQTLTRDEIRRHNEQVLKELAEFNNANSNKNQPAFLEMQEAIDELNLLVDSSSPQTPIDVSVKRVTEAFRAINSL